MFFPMIGITPRMISTSSSSDFIRWDIWIARVEYEDGTESKIRPVLIIDGTHCYVLSLKITSHAPRSQFPGEYQIVEWKEAGLLKPSTIRINKRLNLPADSFVKKIGRLTELDRFNVSRIYLELFFDKKDRLPPWSDVGCTGFTFGY